MRQDIPYQIDHALFERLVHGDEEAFEKLVYTLYKKLFPFAVSLIKSESEANDVLQEVFLKIWLHRSSFSAIENPMGWIHTVVANTASNYLRTKIRNELRIKKYHSQSVVSAGMEEQLDANFTQSLIDEAVNKLPAKRKQVFLLSRKEGLSRKEIATRLNVSENTVRNQLVEALQFVREYLTQRGGLTIPAILILMDIL
ncbi:RNA polymerase sigma-70 factor [Agriterribacter sp.]|uniref:RNA polymerase sigma factor n=1 Tax=Agriterribacter sp. TaxID=2821509 RepID=UPI002C8C5F47|nr:RNA polymerase sigma-70 factor [Agriterribacter sp.]HTN07772.1 RNA polymerase sigma-70 factor [Agriterribacter sp.]